MSYLWSFSPEPDPKSDYQPYRPVIRKPKRSSWTAPEHAKGAMEMKRDYPRDDLGRVLEGREKVLVLDNRPKIMIPERRKRFLTFSEKTPNPAGVRKW